jgi:hypothetical protein
MANSNMSLPQRKRGVAIMSREDAIKLHRFGVIPVCDGKLL